MQPLAYGRSSESILADADGRQGRDYTTFTVSVRPEACLFLAVTSRRFRREVRRTVNCNVKVAYFSALAPRLPTPRATS